MTSGRWFLIAPLESSQDYLPADNHAYALLPERRRAKVLVVTEGMDDGVAWEKTALVSYEEAFKQELIHFHDCIANGRRPRTDGEDGKRDVVLLRDLTLAWQRAQQQR